MKISNFVVFGALSLATYLLTQLETLTLVKISFIGTPIIIVLLLGSLFTYKAYKKSGKNEKDFPLFFQVPENHKFILRSAFGSKADDGTGKSKLYWAFDEGWAFWVPFFTIPVGIVSTRKNQTDLPALPVNDGDSQNMLIDGQYVSQITDAIKYVANVEGVTMEEKHQERLRIEKDLIHTAFNRAASLYDTETFLSLIRADGSQIILGEDALHFFGDKDEDISVSRYGITIHNIGTQKTYAPEIIEKAKERQKAAKIEKESAEDEAEAMKIMIDKTGANPTAVMISQIVSDSLRGLLGLKNK